MMGRIDAFEIINVLIFNAVLEGMISLGFNLNGKLSVSCDSQLILIQLDLENSVIKKRKLETIQKASVWLCFILQDTRGDSRAGVGNV